MVVPKQKLTPMQALEKLKHYCSYTERSHYDVKQQLFAYGVYHADAENIVATLIQENYLNEERYAKQLAGGKHRIKSWGRIKIITALKQKGIDSRYIISEALKEIDDEEYLKKLQFYCNKKWDSLKENQYLIRKKKTIQYLLQKGYELPLIIKAVEKCSGRMQNDDI